MEERKSKKCKKLRVGILLKKKQKGFYALIKL